MFESKEQKRRGMGLATWLSFLLFSAFIVFYYCFQADDEKWFLDAVFYLATNLLLDDKVFGELF